MTRRPVSQPDSLEMLLDTMCNTFGAIILIALLVALLAREVKRNEFETRRLSQTEESLQRQITRAEQDVTEAQTLQAELAQQAQQSAQSGLLALVLERQELRSTLAVLAETAQSHESQLATGAVTRLATLNEQLRQENQRTTTAETERLRERNLREELRRQIETQQRGLAGDSNRLAQARARRVQSLRLPREHPTTRSHFYLVLRYGLVYPVYFLRNGNPQENTNSITWQSEGPNVRRVEPIPTRGLNPLTDAAGLTRLLQMIPADRHYLVFQVYADSFAAFTATKEAAVRLGFEFTWEPRKDDTVLRLGPSGPPPPPQ